MKETKLPFISVLGIPLVIYLAWLAEIFLLEGSLMLFQSPVLQPLLLYTLAGCIVTGLFFPLFLLRRSFASGAVTMYQIGFRSLKRTVWLLGAALFFMVIPLILLLPSESARVSFSGYFILYLPTGIAAIMVCWVLLGTHIQALVRSSGIVVSVSTGMAATAVLYAVSSLAHTPISGAQDPVLPAFIIGLVTAFVFFSARDVYVAVLTVTAGMSFLSAGASAGGLSPGPSLPVILAALITLAALCGVHWYLARTFITVKVFPGS